MAVPMTKDQCDKISSFADHVREFYTDEELVSQLAYMMDHTPDITISRAEVSRRATDLVQGGSFLVYYDQIDEFARETHLIDRRFGDQRRWESYVDRMARAIVRICARAELNFDQLRKAAISSIWNKQLLLFPHGEFRMRLSPASCFLAQKAGIDCDVDRGEDGLITVRKVDRHE